MRKRWIGRFTIGFIPILGCLAFVLAQQDTETEDVDGASEMQASTVLDQTQPIAFPHSIHAGVDQIDCQYCHFSAERSVDAGIPPVSTCMGCHTVIGGSDEVQQAEIQKVRDYWTNQEPIPWVRIYKVADHVHFPHMRHVAANVDCTTCHGEVKEMDVIETVNQPLSMGWCVSCHVEQDVRRDCTVCHY